MRKVIVGKNISFVSTSSSSPGMMQVTGVDGYDTPRLSLPCLSDEAAVDKAVVNVSHFLP